MTPPTPHQLAARLAFSADLLAELSVAILANISGLPDTRASHRIQETCDDLAAISCVHRRLAEGIKRNSQTRQQTAAISSKNTSPEGLHPCAIG